MFSGWSAPLYLAGGGFLLGARSCLRIDPANRSE
jgi:hypothetical protein